jgi:hypothetical protein
MAIVVMAPIATTDASQLVRMVAFLSPARVARQ